MGALLPQSRNFPAEPSRPYTIYLALCAGMPIRRGLHGVNMTLEERKRLARLGILVVVGGLFVIALIDQAIVGHQLSKDYPYDGLTAEQVVKITDHCNQKPRPWDCQ